MCSALLLYEYVESLIVVEISNICSHLKTKRKRCFGDFPCFITRFDANVSLLQLLNHNNTVFSINTIIYGKVEDDMNN